MLDMASFVVEFIDEMVHTTSKRKMLNMKKQCKMDDPLIDDLRIDVLLFFGQSHVHGGVQKLKRYNPPGDLHKGGRRLTVR